MIKLGEVNSRMKDFYDIWLLSQQFEFNGGELAKAIKLTFENRETLMPTVITAFSNKFINAKDKQWTVFHKRLGQEYLPADFAEIVARIEMFLNPIAAAFIAGEKFNQKWSTSNE